MITPIAILICIRAFVHSTAIAKLPFATEVSDMKATNMLNKRPSLKSLHLTRTEGQSMLSSLQDLETTLENTGDKWDQRITNIIASHQISNSGFPESASVNDDLKSIRNRLLSASLNNGRRKKQGVSLNFPTRRNNASESNKAWASKGTGTKAPVLPSSSPLPSPDHTVQIAVPKTSNATHPKSRIPFDTPNGHANVSEASSFKASAGNSSLTVAAGSAEIEVIVFEQHLPTTSTRTLAVADHDRHQPTSMLTARNITFFQASVLRHAYSIRSYWPIYLTLVLMALCAMGMVVLCCTNLGRRDMPEQQVKPPDQQLPPYGYAFSYDMRTADGQPPKTH